MLTEKDLLELKQEVANAKSTSSELQGQKKTLLSQLSETWVVKNLDEARKALTKIGKDRVAVKKRIEERTEKLETDYNIDGT